MMWATGISSSFLVCGQAPGPLTTVRRRGFTLIELLIVMLIISVMIGAATMTLKRDYRDLLVTEANRLKALVALGRDEALFQARTVGLRFSDSGYEFVIRGERPGVWRSPGDRQFRSRQLTKGVQLELFRQQVAIDLGDDAGGEGNKSPHVFLLPGGEITPFQAVFSYPAKARLELSFDALGQATVVSSEEF